VPHLATGDMLRAHVDAQTEVGREAREFMDRGELVPDDLVVRLVAERLAAPGATVGFVLDGFPRTLAQAEAAYEWGQRNGRRFQAVVALEVPETELVQRLLTRGRIQGRSDDSEATIRNRLAIYAERTQPLLDYYAGREILIRVDGTGTVDEVFRRIEKSLEARGITPA
jgi:adenylate kinase